MRDISTNQRPVLMAAAIASAVMVALGVGYRATAAWLSTPVNADPVTQEMLEKLPLQIAGWNGQNIPIDPNVVAATDTDACLSRRYEKGNGTEAILLWVASGVQVRDLMPHRPEVCYVGSGYTLMGQRVADLLLAPDLSLKCNVMRFSRGADRVIVLYYYIVDGLYCQDVSQFRYRIRDRIGYVTQVQVVATIRTPPGANVVQEMVFGFAKASAGPLAELFKDLSEAQSQN